MYRDLEDYINRRMRMQHVYQPVMLMTLLQSGGKATEREIGKALLLHDESQIEYYMHATRDMVGGVLRDHRLAERDRKTRTWHLNGFEQLSADEISKLTKLCEQKLGRFKEDRGNQIYAHRRRPSSYVSRELPHL